MKRLHLLWMLILLMLLQVSPVQAQFAPTCHYETDGTLVCTLGGGFGGGGGGGGGTGGGGTCTPGQHMVYQITGYDPVTKTCSAVPVMVDNCSGQIIEAAGDSVDDLPCNFGQPTAENPCDILTAGAGGFSCEATDWSLEVRVSFPAIHLDVRPYPVTLVRWPTAIRNGGLPTASGVGGIAYLPYGGGSPDDPHVGDWRDLRLTLSLRPAGDMSVSLPHIGTLELPDQGETGSPRFIRWELPSHPAVGGGTLAGSVRGMDELPSDIPLFVGRGRAPYRLFWELRYYAYQPIRECLPGPGINGQTNCGNGSGHNEIVGYDWRRHASGGEISPDEVQDLPASLMADLNRDGHPDAYWDNNLNLRRMDNNNRVDNPRYQRSWNWGGLIYWAVREGQGQIGWPGE